MPAPGNGPEGPETRGRCLLLAGPTASGKSAVALLLAERLDGEIVSVDSMQVYRGLDLGTAKPTAAERARVPHHLLDVADLTESFDAARFLGLASGAVKEIQSRGRLPILCGGTGLYFKVFLEGLGTVPASDPLLRAELEKVPLASLLQELESLDPVTFHRIDRQNPRRVVRAVEVLRLTGQPLGGQRSGWLKPGADPMGSVVFGLERDAEDLRRRIDARVDQMFSSGLVDETAALLDRGLAANPTALQAIGYRQVVEHLRGERSLAATVELVKVKTRQYAKRQRTWFRHQLPMQWIESGGAQPPEAMADRIAAAFRQP